MPEIRLLDRSSAALQEALEIPRRVLWLQKECAHIRKGRVVSTRDLAADMLAEEKRLGEDSKHKLELNLRATKMILADLAKTRAELLATIKRESVSLALFPPGKDGPIVLPDTFEAQFPVITRASRLISDGASQRDSNQLTVQHCVSTLARVRESLEVSLRNAVQADHAEEVQLKLAEGTARITLNASTRALKQAKLQADIMAGPSDAAFLTTAEKIDRPMVRVYEKHHAHPAGQTARAEHGIPETKHLNATVSLEANSTAKIGELLFRWWTSKIDAISDKALHAVQAAEHDRVMSRRTDEAILRTRIMLAPGRRVK